jgi:uncharacterized protein (DUF433 family)
MTSVNWQERISVNPAVRSGKPCIKGTRIAVYDVLEYLAGGMTEDQILVDFPDLTRDDIRACLAFAAARQWSLAWPPSIPAALMSGRSAFVERQILRFGSTRVLSRNRTEDSCFHAAVPMGLSWKPSAAARRLSAATLRWRCCSS